MLKINDVSWGQFKVGDIFTIENCKCSNVSKLDEGNIPYIGATNRNNGLLKFINDDSLITKGNCIVFICDGDGSIGYSIYKKEDFIGSTTLKVGRNKKLNKHSSLFITTIADRVREKYNFGFKRNDKHLRNEILLLPQDESCQPHWEFMESYMKEKEEKLLEKYKEYIIATFEKLIKDIPNKLEKFSSKKWKEFSISEISEIESGKDIYESERIEGEIPYISAKSKDNGIGHFVDNENNTLESNCVSVNRNGSVGYAFYHPYNALYSNDCRKLRLNKNKYVSLFIVNQISLQKDKYGYGYKMGTGRLKKQKIMLPIDDSMNPDYLFMEKYMKKIEAEQINKYLEFIKDRL